MVPPIGVPEFAIGAQRLHETLHGTEVVKRAEAGRLVASRAMQAAQIVGEQFLALRSSERDIRIEQEGSEIVLGEPGAQALEVDETHFAIAHDNVLALE